MNKSILLESLKEMKVQQCSLLLRKKEETTSDFSQNSVTVV